MDTLISFIHEKPTLYGQLLIDNKSRIGAWKPEWKYFPVNALVYAFYKDNGEKKSNIAISKEKAYQRFKEGRLSVDPEDGKLENYV